MQTKLNRIILILALAVFSTSCLVPTSKETYLENFERFVKDVEKNCEKFKASDWRWANARFSKYSDEWFEKYRDELNLEEKMEVTSLKARYLGAKEGNTIGRMINENLKKGLDQMEKEMKKYIEEDLDEDLEEIKKGAKEIGDSAVKVMEDVMKEIKKKN